MRRDHFPLDQSRGAVLEGVKSVLGLKELAGLERWKREQGGGVAARGCMSKRHENQERDLGAGQQGNPQKASLQLEVLHSVASLRKELICRLQSLSLYRNPKARSHKLNIILRDSKHLCL